jgi:hypothetical protein
VSPVFVAAENFVFISVFISFRRRSVPWQVGGVNLDGHLDGHLDGNLGGHSGANGANGGGRIAKPHA